MAEIEQDFLGYIAKAIVEKPEGVNITRTLDKKGVLLELKVDPEDVGKVIGKRGSTVNAIRTLLRVLGAKHDARYSLKVNEPQDNFTKPTEEKADDSNAEEIASEKKDSKSAEQKVEDEISSVKAKAKEGLEDLDDLEI